MLPLHRRFGKPEKRRCGARCVAARSNRLRIDHDPQGERKARDVDRVVPGQLPRDALKDDGTSIACVTPADA
jgi:hypothetical protein